MRPKGKAKLKTERVASLNKGSSRGRPAIRQEFLILDFRFAIGRGFKVLNSLSNQNQKSQI
jgi:hypothetical protein